MLIRILVLLLVGLVPVPGISQSYNGTCSTREDVEALPPGTWCEVANTRLRDFEKAPDEWADWNGSSSASYESYQRNSGIRGIMAFSGGAFDTRRDRLLVAGGGHNDYGGNEIFAFSLQSLTWTRVSEPTAFPNRHPAIVNDDGTPISRHTYKGIEYLPDQDSLFLFGGSPDSSGGGCGVDGVWMFDLRAREVTGQYSNLQWSRLASSNDPENGCEIQALFDSKNRSILFNDHRGWFRLDLASYEWTQLNSASYEQRKTMAVIPDGADYLVHTGNGKFDGYMKRDLNSGKLEGLDISTSGAKTVEESDVSALAFDTKSGKVVGWVGGTDIYALDLATNVWARHSPAEENSVSPGSVSDSVYGRFRYSPASNVFVLATSVSSNVFLYRFADGSGVVDVKPDPPGDLVAE